VPERASDQLLAAEEAAERARRLGPVPYSALGPVPGLALPPAEELAPWTADTIDEIWFAEGRPDPFIYVEVGAGDGRRARELLKLGPACLDALRIVLVEDDRTLRERHAEHLSIESPALILGPVAPSDDPDEGSRPPPGIGPLVTSLAELPALSTSSAGVVIASGWLSRQPSDRYEWRDGTWWEIRLGVVPPADRALTEIAVPVSGERARAMDELAGDRFEGARYADPVGGVAWLKAALGTAETGWLLAVDRWTAKMEPLAGDGPTPVPLEPLASIRQPVGGPSASVTHLQVVRWRLG
jgi:hypothetical protein